MTWGRVSTHIYRLLLQHIELYWISYHYTFHIYSPAHKCNHISISSIYSVGQACVLLHMDDKGFLLGQSVKVKIICSKGCKNPHYNQDDNHEMVTVIECVSADGRVIPPMYNYKGTMHLMGWHSYTFRIGRTCKVRDNHMMLKSQGARLRIIDYNPVLSPHQWLSGPESSTQSVWSTVPSVRHHSGLAWDGNSPSVPRMLQKFGSRMGTDSKDTRGCSSAVLSGHLPTSMDAVQSMP
jgi:hypothetical protein